MLGSLISAGASLLGGILGNNAAEKNARNNERLQREFATHGIRWKVEDAKAAGIHPIYALGAPTTSYAPQSIGDSLGTGIRAAGQDIGRAINSTSSPTERVTAETAAFNALQLEKGGLENELLRTQIARMRQNENPPIPDVGQLYGIPGQGSTAKMSVPADKTERSGWNPDNPSMESHATSDIGWARAADGTWAMIPGKDTKNRIEDMEWYERQHFIRNQVAPFFSEHGFQGPFPAPTGERWVFNPITGKAWLEPLSGAGKWATPGLRRNR